MRRGQNFRGTKLYDVFSFNAGLALADVRLSHGNILVLSCVELNIVVFHRFQ